MACPVYKLAMRFNKLFNRIAANSDKGSEDSRSKILDCIHAIGIYDWFLDFDPTAINMFTGVEFTESGDLRRFINRILLMTNGSFTNPKGICGDITIFTKLIRNTLTARYEGNAASDGRTLPQDIMLDQEDRDAILEEKIQALIDCLVAQFCGLEVDIRPESSRCCVDGVEVDGINNPSDCWDLGGNWSDQDCGIFVQQ